MRLPRDRVVLVTGASRGIGFATAQAFLNDGARVAALARSRITGLSALCLSGDVRRKEEMTSAVDAVVRHYGELHVLVCNAGIGLYSRVEDLQEEHLQDLFATNVYGPIFTIQAALPHLARTGGQIVLISSAMARSSVPFSGAYAMTKHALHALALSARVELRPRGVSVVEVAPWITETGFGAAARVVGFRSAPSLATSGAGWSPNRVAQAILRASKTGRREVWLSAKGAAFSWAQKLLPGWMDRYLERRMNRLLASQDAAAAKPPPSL